MPTMRHERVDDPSTQLKAIEVALLVGKMGMFTIANKILYRYNHHRPEDLMEYPGTAYFLSVQFVIGPVIYLTVAMVRYLKSPSLRQYVARVVTSYKF